MYRLAAVPAVAVAMFVTACGGSEQSSTAAKPSGGAAATATAESYEGKVLRVGLYGGTWLDGVKATAAKKFEEATGATVEYTEGNPSDLAAKLYASDSQGQKPPLDVIETENLVQAQLAERGLLLPADEYKDKAEGIFGNVTDPPATAGQTPPHCDWYLVLAYNKDKFKELGLPEPKSWADLWNPKLAGHVALPDISTAMGIPSVFAAAGVANGDPYDFEAGVKKLGEIKTYSVYKSSSDMQADFASGNIWAAPAADGRAWQLVDDKQPIGVVIPEVPGSGKKGPIAGHCFLDVVKGSDNPGLAAEFIKATYSDEVQAEFAELTGYPPNSQSGVDMLKEKYPEWKPRLPTKEEFAQYLNMDWSKIIPQAREVTKSFSRTVGR
jgi:putative spermidine/putrescine transport system substrate-binding protein